MPIYDSDDDISMASSVSFSDNRKRMDADGRSIASTVGLSSQGGDDPDHIVPSSGKKPKKKKDFLGRDVDENAPAQQEDHAVLMSKIGVVVVLVVFTFIFGIATYSFTRKQQEENFEKAFEEFATQVSDLSTIRMQNVYETFHSLSVQATAYAVGTGANWPLVTIPGFEAQVDIGIEQTKARVVAVQPLVTPNQRSKWESYVQTTSLQWVQESYDHIDPFGESNTTLELPLIPPFVWSTSPDTASPYSDDPFYMFHENYHAPVWQVAPIVNHSNLINYDVFAYNPFMDAFQRLVDNPGRATISNIVNLDMDDPNATDISPESFFAIPVMESLTPKSSGRRGDHGIVGVITAFVEWRHYFQGLLPNEVIGVHAIVENSCGLDGEQQVFSFDLSGPNVTFMGAVDIHDWVYDDLVITVNLTSALFGNETADGDSASDIDCQHVVRFYPSDEMKEFYMNVAPIIYAGFVVFVFILTAGVFILYDWLVERRQGKVMDSATRSNAIVSSLFPENVRGRLMAEAGSGGSVGGDLDASETGDDPEDIARDQILTTRPIADLFTDCTVLFADICGFTAWSSEREPHEVFTLLEFVYNSFDKIARRLNVFKVETIGDCYVAVVGLPEPAEDHALIMARFARACMTTMTEVVHTLELTLGPGTSDLAMRFGLHSGPVTAGVLRGDKSRFQLFGDTVNTAARMESSGQKNKIHVSQQCMECLVDAGKGHWIRKRDSPVSLKGKGQLQTYWVKTIAPAASEATADMSDSSTNSSIQSGEERFRKSSNRISESQRRLVVWNVEMLQRLLKKIVAMRAYEYQDTVKDVLEIEPYLRITTNDNETVLDEVKEIITLPAKATQYKQDPNFVELNPEVVEQLSSYVTAIASMYNDNAFHSFYHASHVTQSVIKLMSRIVASESADLTGDPGHKDRFDDHEHSHDHTYGITSDPLTQFAVAFSALIHDVDHPGVPNSQLVEEESEIAKIYRNQSIAEQNSVDIAWDLLMEPQYNALRACIYSNRTELERFRQLVVNSVMATDLADKELGLLRKNRWKKAFHNEFEVAAEYNDELLSQADVNRKATIVIEHLIQASDVSHTMQHWNVYMKWNEKLFHEMYQAFRCGRAETDPSEGWYKGEIGFFDHYVIPLTNKLKECGVFGVSSDEYLNYAQANRDEWEQKGDEIVKQYLMKYHKEHAKHEKKEQEPEEIQQSVDGEGNPANLVLENMPPMGDGDEASAVPSVRPDGMDQQYDYQEGAASFKPLTELWDNPEHSGYDQQYQDGGAPAYQDGQYQGYQDGQYQGYQDGQYQEGAPPMYDQQYQQQYEYPPEGDPNYPPPYPPQDPYQQPPPYQDYQNPPTEEINAEGAE